VIIGEYLASQPGQRDRIVLGTKFFWNLRPGDPNGGGPGRKAVIQQLENSLRRLRTDYVDIYWLHNFDPVTPVGETLRALDDLVAAGKIRYVGFSDVPAWATAEAATIARFHGWAPIVALQLEYSLLERTSEGELIPMAQAMGMGVLPWGPLRSGFLSGKYSSTTAGDADTLRTALVGPPPGGLPGDRHGQRDRGGDRRQPRGRGARLDPAAARDYLHGIRAAAELPGSQQRRVRPPGAQRRHHRRRRPDPCAAAARQRGTRVLTACGVTMTGAPRPAGSSCSRSR
jgi:hypothetical protein